MLRTHLEIETTFEVDDAFALPDLSVTEGVATSGPTQQHELVSTYLDTAQLRLVAAGITLRRRTGGLDAGWHLKLPVGADTRQEVRAPVGAARRPPAALVRLVRVHVRDHPLRTIATLRTTRVLHRLLDDDGTVVAEVCDDRVVAVVAGQPERRWREIEVELVEGGRTLLSAVGTSLFAAGARPARSGSKLVRALGPLLPPPAPQETRSGSTAGALAMRYVSEQVHQLEAADPQVRADAEDAVHRMRVAVRRLRSTLTTYRPLFQRDVTEPVRAELKWLAAQLGPARDLEVLRARLGDLLCEDGVADRQLRSHVDRQLVARRRAAHRRLVHQLDTQRYFRLLDSLDVLVSRPPLVPGPKKKRKPMRKKASQDLRRLMKRSWKALRRAVEAANEPDLDETERIDRLHEARKKAKRARYAAEAAAAMFGEPAKRLGSRLKHVQSALGQVQDSAVASAELGRLAVDADGAFALGRAQVLEEQRLKQSVEDSAVVWADASGPALRAWLD
ncbi:MAG: CYTH and CHAD domain-containing protein [Geodermatophilaceae bacterium]